MTPAEKKTAHKLCTLADGETHNFPKTNCKLCNAIALAITEAVAQEREECSRMAPGCASPATLRAAIRSRTHKPAEGKK